MYNIVTKINVETISIHFKVFLQVNIVLVNPDFN